MFQVSSAKQKAVKDDQPTQASMRASSNEKVRRNPSTDQRKVRRQMNKKQGSYPDDFSNWLDQVDQALLIITGVDVSTAGERGVKFLPLYHTMISPMEAVTEVMRQLGLRATASTHTASDFDQSDFDANAAFWSSRADAERAKEQRRQELYGWKGQEVVVVGGRKIPKGTRGICFYSGAGQYGWRIGFKDAAGQEYWTDLNNVELASAHTGSARFCSCVTSSHHHSSIDDWEEERRYCDACGWPCPNCSGMVVDSHGRVVKASMNHGASSPEGVYNDDGEPLGFDYPSYPGEDDSSNGPDEYGDDDWDEREASLRSTASAWTEDELRTALGDEWYALFQSTVSALDDAGRESFLNQSLPEIVSFFRIMHAWRNTPQQFPWQKKAGRPGDEAFDEYEKDDWSPQDGEPKYPELFEDDDDFYDDFVHESKIERHAIADEFDLRPLHTRVATAFLKKG